MATLKKVKSNVNKARKLVNTLGSSLGTSQYDTNINDLTNQITNMNPFSYNAATDPSYQNYLHQAVRSGRNAMLDNQSAAALNTGGFANSYGTTSGQQAYNAYLKDAQDQIPALMNAAYGIYQNKQNDLYNQLGTYQGLAEADRARQQQSYDNALNNLNYWTGVYQDKRNFQYTKKQNKKNYK